MRLTEWPSVCSRSLCLFDLEDTIIETHDWAMNYVWQHYEQGEFLSPAVNIVQSPHGACQESKERLEQVDEVKHWKSEKFYFHVFEKAPRCSTSAISAFFGRRLDLLSTNQRQCGVLNLLAPWPPRRPSSWDRCSHHVVDAPKQATKACSSKYQRNRSAVARSRVWAQACCISHYGTDQR